MLECVINISEGRDLELVGRIAAEAGTALLDVHSDAHHNRSVLTVVGEESPRAVASAAIEHLDLNHHSGVHPRLGVCDVVPFVALDGSTAADALRARDAFATWLTATHAVPCFLYGPERTLPEVRRTAFTSLLPDIGAPAPHPTAGAAAVGQRPPLVAYNVLFDGGDIALARRAASAVRGDGIRSLGLQAGHRLQVSMNLIEPDRVGPAEAYDRVARALSGVGSRVTGAELVGLVPRSVLDQAALHRWGELDLSEDRTIEARLDRQGWR